MASKFDIEVQGPNSNPPRKQARIKVIDHDQDESTGWLKIKLPPGPASDEAIVAHGFRQHPVVASFLSEARQVAYAVYLNEDDFDIHAFFPRMEALVSQSSLESATEPAAAAPSASPRM